ncbi:uncharacterized protein LOC135494327 [Lineus longissimus]|uniref:uncharacterized protein LOC135494327 n=1 Tax=Lineus longissimus TaxID=88925 RepID=UPI00315CD315
MAGIVNISSDSDTSSDFFDYSSSDSDEYCMRFEEAGLEKPNDTDQDRVMIMPYLYEPEPFEDEPVQPADLDAMEVEDEIDYSVIENWCTCSNCQVLPTRKECVCCQTIGSYCAKLADFEEEVEQECITKHSGFSPVCLNKYLLETAWLQYRQQYGKKAFTGPDHKRNRHVAYRQLVRWCYGFLGKDIRVFLPACAVAMIRAFFPPPGMEEEAEFVGFVDFDA